MRWLKGNPKLNIQLFNSSYYQRRKYRPVGNTVLLRFAALHMPCVVG